MILILKPTRQYLPDLLGNYYLLGNIYPAIFAQHCHTHYNYIGDDKQVSSADYLRSENVNSADLYLLRIVRNGIDIAMHKPCQFNQMQMRIIRRKLGFYTIKSVYINECRDICKGTFNNICRYTCNNRGIYVCNYAYK